MVWVGGCCGWGVKVVCFWVMLFIHGLCWVVWLVVIVVGVACVFRRLGWVTLPVVFLVVGLVYCWEISGGLVFACGLVGSSVGVVDPVVCPSSVCRGVLSINDLFLHLFAICIAISGLNGPSSRVGKLFHLCEGSQMWRVFAIECIPHDMVSLCATTTAYWMTGVRGSAQMCSICSATNTADTMVCIVVVGIMLGRES